MTKKNFLKTFDKNEKKYGKEWVSGFDKNGNPILWADKLTKSIANDLKKSKISKKTAYLTKSIIIRILYIAMFDMYRYNASLQNKILSCNDPSQTNYIEKESIINEVNTILQGTSTLSGDWSINTLSDIYAFSKKDSCAKSREALYTLLKLAIVYKGNFEASSYVEKNSFAEKTYSFLKDDLIDIMYALNFYYIKKERI